MHNSAEAKSLSISSLSLNGQRAYIFCKEGGDHGFTKNS